MTLTQSVAEHIIQKLLKAEDYRVEVVDLINAEFLQYAVDFFKKVIDAKLRSQLITVDWYKKEFLDRTLPSGELAIHSGLNTKTIQNMYNSASRQVVLDASYEHYEKLFETIKRLVEEERDLELTLTIKLRGVSVDLNVSESLIVINTLAVKRAELRGGLWSTAGKRVEKPLMTTFCMLFNVDEANYEIKVRGKSFARPEFQREIDFYLLSGGERHKCEVKLMGKGNPESADAVIARASKVFVADKLSDMNKKQLDSIGVNWVELRSANGFKRFEQVLTKLGIPHTDFSGVLDQELPRIFEKAFAQRI